MAKYYFFFPEDTGLTYIQPVKAKDIHKAREIMNFFFVRFVNYGYTITELISEDKYHTDNFLPLLNKRIMEEVLDERSKLV